jgi:acyl-CoA synthetase (AMP-forming)/AMP-acid ligase II
MVFAPWYADVQEKAPEVAPTEVSKYEAAATRHWGILKDYEHPIRYADAGVASSTSELFSHINCKTIPEFFEKAVEQHGDKPAMRVERPCPEVVPIKDEVTGKVKGWRADPSLPVDQWKTWTYAEYLADVKRAARAMMACGVEQFDSVNIFGFNSPEWFISDLGAIFCGAKAAGIYPTDTPEQASYKCLHSDAKVVIVEDQSKIDKFAERINELPQLNAIVIWGGAPKQASIARSDGTKVPVYEWAAFLQLSEKVTEVALRSRIAAIKAGHCCTLIYTSGTTGNPKAVMISHDNIAFEAGSVLHMIKDVFGNQVTDTVAVEATVAVRCGYARPLLTTVPRSLNRSGSFRICRCRTWRAPWST